MTYRQRNKNKNMGTKILIGCVVAFVVLRIFGINFTDGVLKNSFNYIMESRTAAFAPLKNSLVYFQSKKTLEEENRRLKGENLNLNLSTLTNQTLNQEFEGYRNQFADVAAGSNPIKVILKPPFMPFDIIRLGGDVEQYTVGNLVFYKNVIIGSLVEKTSRYASVELFSTPGKVTPASIKGTQFEAKGLGGGRYVMEVSKDFEVSEGDAIVYPHEKVVLLGVVGEIESNEEDLFKKIYFNTPVPISSISYVTIGIQSYEQTQPSN